MRLEHNRSNFEPIYIVIESESELEELYGVLCYSPITHLNSTTKKLFDLLNTLDDERQYGINYDKHFNKAQSTLKRVKDAI